MLPTFSDRWRSTLDWCPTPEQQQHFEVLYQGIVAANQHLNLTRITEPEAFWEKHLWDSMSGLSFFLPGGDRDPLPTPARIVDIGTGSGFPGLPAGLLWTQSEVALLDSTVKKLRFLDELLATLPLPQVKTLAGRAEALGQDPRHRETYDLALARAVGGVTICAEYAMPLVRREGYVVLYRGQWSAAEEASLSRALIQLGGVIDRITPFQTPLTQGVRHCILVHKTADTPESYPRPVGVPAQKPLGLLP